MVKKIISIIVMLFAILIIPAFSFADDVASVGVTASVSTDVENSSINLSKEDILLLSDNLGAELRLLQLESSIQAQISGGKLIIANLENNSDVNMTIISDLKNIIIELENLSQLINASIQYNSTDDLAALFIESKAKAIELTKEFKLIADSNLNEDMISELRNQYQNKKKLTLKIQNKKIDSVRKKYNGNLISNRFKLIGKFNSSLIEDYENGKIDINSLKKNLINGFKSIDSQKRMNISKLMNNNYRSSLMKTEKDLNEVKNKIRKFAQERNNIINKYQGKSNGYLNKYINNSSMNLSRNDIKRIQKEIKSMNETQIQKLKDEYAPGTQIKMNSSFKMGARHNNSFHQRVPGVTTEGGEQ